MNQMRPNSIQARDIASVVHPQTNLASHEERGPTVITEGRGIYVVDDTGQEIMDCAAGLWCASLGFSSERLAKVAYEQMRRLGFAHIYRHHTHPACVELAERLLEIAPVPMAKVLFQCSGSEANDTAIKLAWYYNAALGRPAKRKIIGRKLGYHGSTCAAISASGKSDMHADFGLPFADFLHTECPHYYSMHADGETEAEFATRMVDSLETLIAAEGPETIAAFIAEPVMGAGGGLVPPDTYFAKVQTLLRRHDILFIADEIICGFGRTGNMWGSQTFGLRPDMITCAKALSAGMQPISALLINERIYQAMLHESRKLGAFAHGFTYAGHPVAAAVALEVQRIYEEMDLLGHVREGAVHIERELAKIGEHPLIGDVRGVGMLWGLQMTADKASRRLFDPAQKVGAIFDHNARSRHLIMRVIGDRIIFSPPLVITQPEIDEAMRRLRGALDATCLNL